MTRIITPLKFICIAVAYIPLLKGVGFTPHFITEESWKKLQEMRKSFDFILIGGWAIYVYTKMHKDKIKVKILSLP